MGQPPATARHCITLARLEVVMVPGLAERERASLREQWTDWMRVVSPPLAGHRLFRIGATGHPSRLSAALRATIRGRGVRAEAFGARHVLREELLKGY
ncbi:MAG: hypothetical protein KC442_00490 [Thermomicrobiales bacterium]|nr:hypothetical protein [Thermomicrobiales bacterium]